jgi:hypothetical protein
LLEVPHRSAEAGSPDSTTFHAPSLSDLLDAGILPFRLVGTHRRVKVTDLIAYKQDDDAKRKDVMAELAAEAQKHGLGY